MYSGGASLKKSRVGSLSALATALLLGGCGGQSLNLVARGMDVRWAGPAHTVKAYISNPSAQAAGPFLVYFDADEDPTSDRDRPQVAVEVAGVAAHSTVEVDADFSPLATTANALLSRVKWITLRVDPKLTIVESNEQDNTLVTQLPDAMGASAIVAPMLRPTAYFEAWTGVNPLAQTLIPATDMDVVGVEFSILACVPSTSEVLTFTVRQGADVLAAIPMQASGFVVDCNSFPPAISGQSVGTGYFDLRQTPVHMSAGTEYTLELANPSNHVLHVGAGADAVNGTIHESGLSHPLADLTFKLYAGS